jgi:hypothetical protein
MKTKLALVCIALLFISSCTPSTQRRDLLEIITNSSCEPPCWQGITPGETTFAEVKEIVQYLQTDGTKNHVGTLEEVRINEENNRILIFYDQPPIVIGLHASSHGVIEKIEFSIDYVNKINQIKLGDLIDYLGDPQEISVCYLNFIIRRAYMRISYSQIELNFDRERLPLDADSFQIPISRNTSIDTITYYDSWIPPMNEISKPWTGYGNFHFSPADPNATIKQCEGN